MAITVMHGQTTNALVGRGVNCSLATLLRMQPFHLSCGDSLTHTLNSWYPFVFTIPDVSVRYFSASIPFITFLFDALPPPPPFGPAPMAVKLQQRWQIQFVPNVLLQKPGILFIFWLGHTSSNRGTEHGAELRWRHGYWLLKPFYGHYFQLG